MGLATLVIITGVIAALVWHAPRLVIVGAFLLVIPGLILAFMPTAFVYLLATLVIRTILPIDGFGGTALAFALAVALGFLVPWRFRARQTARYAKAMLPEIVPDEPLALGGEVLVVTRRRAGFTLRQPHCEALCAALLATPGVTGVTLRNEVVGTDDFKQARFSLDPACAGLDGGLAPTRPDEIVSHLPEAPLGAGEDWRNRTDEHAARRKAVISDWTLRLASEAGLVESAAAPAPDWTIAITDGVGAVGHPRIDRLEVTATGAQPALRRSLVAQQLMTTPFLFQFSGDLENASFSIAHTRLANGKVYPEFNATKELLSHTSLAQALPATTQSDELRSALAAMLDNPAAPAELASLARGWMNSLGYNYRAEDMALVHRIIADQRITNIRREVNRFHAKQIPPELRGAMVARILNPASQADERAAYAKLLSKLPEGSFATMTAEEERILADPALRRQAAPLIERLGDQGKPGLARLMRILESEITSHEKWATQRPVIRAVRRGLARLGLEAAAALPRIEELFARPRNPLASLYQEAVEWRIAMARMGKPIDSLPFGVYNKPELLERDKAQVRKRLEDFDPAWESGYSY